MNSSSHFIFDLLRAIGRSETPLGVGELATALDLPPSSVHRGLATLREAGYVESYHLSSRYVLGPRVQTLWSAYFSRMPIRNVGLPFMQQLSRMTGETTSLIVPHGDDGLRIASVRGTREVVSVQPVGEVLPAYTAFAAIRGRGFLLEPVDYEPGRAVAILPIETDDGVIAVLSLDGPVVAANAAANDPDLIAFQAIAAQIAQTCSAPRQRRKKARI